ncbi:MAG: peptidylprolyl isomerase, partial [Oscillospiraceae bacterium]|nr:peptidylprolyl isomerase [Oscillospiraceae bacterium]
QPTHKGVYPVFGKVLEGMDELYRLEKVPTKPVKGPFEGMEINEPIEPEIIEKVTLELFGQTYPDPVKVDTDWIPATWK